MRRQKEASRVRVNRIIADYVEMRYPNIYEEAKMLYTKLDMLYPGKKDLRKTYEFCLLATGSSDNKYRYMRKTQDAVSDKMVLEIPLMHTSTIPTVVPDIPTVAPTIPTVVPDIPTVAPTIPTVVPDIPTVAPTIPTVVPDIPTVAPTIPTVVPDIPTVAPAVIPDIGAEITLPMVPDKIIDEIIMELRQDPEVCNFFDDILVDGETPLESELTALGF